MSTTEEQQQQPRKEEKAEEEERLYKTKVVQFLGRKTLIILQNDNGPCPLLAICNVLLLKNNLNLTLDASEISLQKLLSLVAERLIDSNSNTENVDAGYLENQQQNIADAIDLLPRLATGIDVNIKFRRIDDFEFTRECAIFDLLDIPLYHGWIVDPQDHHTADAIGSKSYNTLMGELVALETRKSEGENKDTEEDCVDFAAATTATLGVPSPCLSRGRSFDDSPPSVSSDQKVRKGDLEEEEELLRVLQLSKTETPNLFDEPQFTETYSNDLSASSADSQDNKNVEFEHPPVDATDGQPMDEQQFQHQELCGLNDSNVLSSYNYDRLSSETSYGDTDHSSSHIRAINPLDQLRSEETKLMEQSSHSESVVQNQSESLPLLKEDSFTPYNDHMQNPEANHDVLMTCPQEVLMSLIDHQREKNESAGETLASARKTESDVVDGMRQNEDLPKVGASSVNDSEPLYEGEDCILDSGCTYENREPMYEGEQILAEQADKGMGDASDIQSKDGITPQKGELIKNFLRNNASQLTIYGLFCLQEGLKERELCVFFRNNHFSTMFKFNGELYLLATDQGYINQPDLVWEKLNEVNGDTVFMTGNFTEFKVDNHGNDTWDEQNAVASTADYLASFDNSAQGGSTMNSDLQLAIQLQQQEFENQPKRHNNLQQSSTSGSSRLVTGPQVQRSQASGSSSTKPDSKSKEKCIVM